MKRLYGVISDQATASEFLNKLYEAGLDDGETKSNFASPIKMISSYTYLTELGNPARAEALNRLHSEGVIQEALSGEAEARVFTDLTKGVVQLPDGAEVAKFADNLYLGVIPPGIEYSWYSTHLVRIMIFQFYTEEVENDGVTETVQRMNEFMLGSNNSNALAPHVAYELTTVYSGDVLVKLAWCAEGCPSTEVALKNVFSALTINKYVVKVENAGHDGAQVIMTQNGGGHSDIVFGAGGPVGGFLLHTMKKETNGSRHAITIFNGDATPLYTWSAGSKPWDELDSTKNYPVNVAANGNISRGRIISSDTYGTGSNPGPLITMSALAPVCTPAIDDIADTAKWMPQGPHDYSYFDNSGHIVMTKGNSPNTVFFADHGLYLYDGEWGDKWSTDGLEVPDIAPSDMVNIKRPEPSSWLPYASRFAAIFDCEDGLSSSAWFNTVDGGDALDMRFIGAPIINSDGSARFINRANNPISGWVPINWGSSAAYNFSFSVEVFKYSYSGDKRNEWAPFVMGAIIGSPWWGGSYFATYHTIDGLKLPMGNSFNLGISNGKPVGAEETLRMYDTDQDRWYIVLQGAESNGNGYFINCFDLETGAKLSGISTKYSTVSINMEIWQRQQNPPVPVDLRFYIGGYPNNDTTWKSEYVQGQLYASPWYGDWARGNNTTSELKIDVKFLALADWSSWSIKYGPSDFVSKVVTEIRRHYGYIE